MKTPNIITTLRIFLMPVFVVVFYLPFSWAHWAAAIIFAFAAVTDWLDGYLARVLNETSPFGEFFDPVADKLIVAVALLLIVGERAFPFITIPAVIIVCREIMISGLREWMAEIGLRKQVNVSFIGKIKTTMQMIAIFLLLIYRPGQHLLLGLVGYLCLYTAAVLTIWSMCIYLKAAWPELRKE